MAFLLNTNYFPIFSGKHKGEWNEYNECHRTPAGFSQFSCIDCHEHDSTGDLADEHDNVSDLAIRAKRFTGAIQKGDKAD